MKPEESTGEGKGQQEGGKCKRREDSERIRKGRLERIGRNHRWADEEKHCLKTNRARPTRSAKYTCRPNRRVEREKKRLRRGALRTDYRQEEIKSFERDGRN